MEIPGPFNLAFLIVALGVSLFYGLKAFDAFGVDTKSKPWAWWAHQIWFNFEG